MKVSFTDLLIHNSSCQTAAFANLFVHKFIYETFTDLLTEEFSSETFQFTDLLIQNFGSESVIYRSSLFVRKFSSKTDSFANSVLKRPYLQIFVCSKLKLTSR